MEKPFPAEYLPPTANAMMVEKLLMTKYWREEGGEGRGGRQGGRGGREGRGEEGEERRNGRKKDG